MKYFNFFFFIFFSLSAAAQIRVDQLTEIDSIASTDAFYTAERGEFQKIYISTLSNYFGSGASVPSVDTISASGETSMVVRYFGATAPILTKTATGQFRLTVASGTALSGFAWTANNTNLTGANTIEITIVGSVDNYSVFQVFSIATGQYFGELYGIVPTQTKPTIGNVKTIFPNMSNFGASGFVIVAKSI